MLSLITEESKVGIVAIDFCHGLGSVFCHLVIHEICVSCYVWRIEVLKNAPKSTQLLSYPRACTSGHHSGPPLTL